jgi:hypothetical protein
MKHSMACEYPEGCSCGASEFNKLREENQRLRAAVLAAIPALDTDRDLTDADVQGTYPALIQRRAALRHCQSALR